MDDLSSDAPIKPQKAPWNHAEAMRAQKLANLERDRLALAEAALEARLRGRLKCCCCQSDQLIAYRHSEDRTQLRCSNCGLGFLDLKRKRGVD